MVLLQRFGVSQGDKVRQIDDFSIGVQNACVTMTDKVTQGADVRWLYQSAKVIRKDLQEQVMKEEVTDVSREV